MNGKIILIIGICLGIGLIGIGIFCLGFEVVTDLWRISRMPLIFGDLTTIAGASQSLAAGFDPLVTNPGDPLGNPAAYPRIWLLLSALIQQTDVPLFGGIIIALFVSGLIIYTPRDLDSITSLILLFCIFSPAVLLGVERGNTDLLIFFLLSLTVYFSARQKILAKLVALASAILAFVLKLYPLFALTYLLREKKRVLIAFLVPTGLFVISYLALTYTDVLLINQVTKKGVSGAYGMTVYWRFMSAHSSYLWRPLRIVSYGGVIYAFLMALTWLREDDRGFNSTQSSRSADMSLSAFRIGTGIHVGTFLWGANWDYRLVFLLLTIPQLVIWSRTASLRVSRTAKVSVIGIILLTWSPIIRLTILSNELIGWVVFMSLINLFAFALPAWLKDAAGKLPLFGIKRRKLFIGLLLISTLISAATFIYLTILPSDLNNAVIFEYSYRRLMLMVGLAFLTLAFMMLLAITIFNQDWSTKVADIVYGNFDDIVRYGSSALVVTYLLISIVYFNKPDWLPEVNIYHMERLFPYFLLPPAFVLIFAWTGRLQ